MTLLSVLLRTAFLLVVVFVGFWLGIAVAMGFDAGWNGPGLLLAGMYLLTFVPALFVAFLPLDRLRRPRLPLKLWYGWLVLLFALIVIGSKGGFKVVDRLAHPQDYGEACWRVREPVPVGGLRIELVEGVMGHREHANGQWDCRSFRIYQQSPYLGFDGSSLGHPLKLQRGGRTCVEIVRGTDGWTTAPASCPK